jgi:hypothetical protein
MVYKFCCCTGVIVLITGIFFITVPPVRYRRYPCLAEQTLYSAVRIIVRYPNIKLFILYLRSVKELGSQGEKTYNLTDASVSDLSSWLEEVIA